MVTIVNRAVVWNAWLHVTVYIITDFDRILKYVKVAQELHQNDLAFMMRAASVTTVESLAC
jgi:hypothetical protein